LGQSGLLPPDQVEELKGQYAARDSTAVSDQLVRQKVLTPYQARRLAEGQHEGLVLGPYHILEELGRGGFGLVYKARHAVMVRVVALKVIAPEWFQDANVLELFEREVATTRLDHPNIARAYDANIIDGTLYLAMEFVDGPSLEKRVKDEGPLPIPLACAVMHQTALTLEYAHQQGMVHGDVKPANLLLPCATGRPTAVPGQLPVLVKVVDFGLARLRPPEGSEQSYTLRQNRGGIGTPGFMSPEQWRNVHEVDIRSDLYSLGCTFYFGLTGRMPFCGATVGETCALHLNQDPTPVTQWRPDAPPAVVGIVRRLMAKKPEARFQTPTELAHALTEAMMVAWQGVSRPSGLARVLVASEMAAPKSAATSLLAEPASSPETPRVPSAGQPATELRPLWREWCAVVEGFARGEPAAVTENEYQALHGSLLAALRTGGTAPSGPRPVLLERLEALVEPWLSLRALADLDLTTLAGLWNTCRRCDAELCPASGGAFGPWVWVVLCIVGGVVASVLLSLARLRPW
jgi:serine/threonine-protein kinase